MAVLRTEEVQVLRSTLFTKPSDEKALFNEISLCELLDLFATIEAQQREITQMQQWVNDLQSGMYVNCVYCGHRYGPEDKVTASMADALKEHVEQCPKHPMSKLKEESQYLKKRNKQLNDENISKQLEKEKLLQEIESLKKAYEITNQSWKKCMGRIMELEAALNNASQYLQDRGYEEESKAIDCQAEL